MEQPKSTHTGVDQDLGSQIKSGQVVTMAIERDRLVSFYVAGGASGFKVEKIADEGGAFSELGYGIGVGGRDVAQLKLSKGYVAVSIERAEGVKDHGFFWDNLKTLEQK